jgi:hypothetical protein
MDSNIIIPLTGIIALVPAAVTAFVLAWREGNRVAAAEAAAEVEGEAL